MATTESQHLWHPDVWADLAQAEFLNNAIVATSSAVVEDNTLEGQPGETIEFPKWLGLSDMEEVAEDEALVPEVLSQSSSKATIKEVGKAVEWTDKAKLVGKGNVQDEAVRQFGILAARKVDADLITASTAVVVGGIEYADGSVSTDSAPLTHTITGGAITWPGLVDGIEEFGDDFEPDEFSGLYIRAEQRSQVLKDEDFIRASELDAGGDGSLVGRGFIGKIGGLNVFVTNRLALGTATVLKKNSLGLLYKRRPLIEQDRNILTRKTVVAQNIHYATKRLNDRGVLALTISS